MTDDQIKAILGHSVATLPTPYDALHEPPANQMTGTRLIMDEELVRHTRAVRDAYAQYLRFHPGRSATIRTWYDEATMTLHSEIVPDRNP
jgi:hypothetical protein